MDVEHKILDLAQHLSTYIVGVVTMVAGGIGVMLERFTLQATYWFKL